MRFLIIGCGSIGSRHAKNFRQLGCAVDICDPDDERRASLVEQLGQSTRAFRTLPDALAQGGYVAAVVATPSHLHLEHARVCLEAGLHLMMEKPLCIGLEEVESFRDEVARSACVLMMAHTYRFRAEWRAVKQMLEQRTLGRIYSAEFSGGWYLPDWHIDQDYRLEYAAQKRQGGGVLLTSMSHFFDVIMWLFGDVTNMSGAKMKVSNLDVDVDDAFVCHMLTAKGIAVTMYEDFLSRFPRRSLRVNAESGFLDIDFNRRQLQRWDASSQRFLPGEKIPGSVSDVFRILEDGVGYDPAPTVEPLRYSGNNAYLEEARHFVGLVEQGARSHDLDVHAGIKVMNLICHDGIADWNPPSGETH